MDKKNSNHTTQGTVVSSRSNNPTEPPIFTKIPGIDQKALAEIFKQKLSLVNSIEIDSECRKSHFIISFLKRYYETGRYLLLRVAFNLSCRGKLRYVNVLLKRLRLLLRPDKYLKDINKQQTLLTQEMLFRFSELYSRLEHHSRLPETRHNLPSWLLAAHQDEFRGSYRELSERFSHYVDILKKRMVAIQTNLPVLDLGCGKGYWLSYLSENGFQVLGVDNNPESCLLARQRGFSVHCEDMIPWLERQEDSSFSAITALQVIEHLEPAILWRLLTLCNRVIVPGGLLLLETPNPENILVSSYYFYLDPTHVRPIPPPLLYFYVMQAGFSSIEIIRLNEQQYLSKKSQNNTLDAIEAKWLNSPMDYAIIASKATVNDG